jgi:archaellum biogenesis ATPase FlaH
MSIENTILRHLIHDEDYARKVIPFLKEEYFQDRGDRLVFSEINKFMMEYNALPTREALNIELEKRSGVPEEEYASACNIVSELTQPDAVEKTWLLESTEHFCQEKAVYNAIMDSIRILDRKDTAKDKNGIPSILTEALAVSFDSHIGHDFLEDSEERYDFYHRVEERIPFDIDYLNKVTRGGLPRKSLNIILAGTGVGKSLAMCHMAAANLSEGRNVLYITMEMAEEKIAERIDANLLNVPLDQLENLPKETYDAKVAKVRSKSKGKLIIKEYPTASAHVGHFRHLINELNLKRSFKPDIIYLDYLNICMSARIKQGSNFNSYSYIKAIAEEVRGLAVEKNVPIVSATQTTRSGYSNSDPGLEDTSESFGLPATADFMIALVSTEELQELNQIMVKQLKNRYSDPAMHRRFVVGVDRAKMRLYDVDENAQKGVMNEDTPVMNNSRFGERQKEDDQMKWATKTMGRKDFSGFKF